MADSTLKAGERPAQPDSQKAGIRLGKEERKELLAEIERLGSRGESPERVLQRAAQALAAGQLERARRLVTHLDGIAPDLAGLEALRAELDQAAGRKRRQANLGQAEEMLRLYIQRRKKRLAELALETLLELAPDHPRRDEYAGWVAELDQELALQRQIEERVATAREALQAGDLATARKFLAALHKIDPDAEAIRELGVELAAVEHEESESADIERLRQRVEELVASERLAEAEREIERLAGLDVPKLTIDFLHKRLEEARAALRDRSDERTMRALYERHLAAGDWQAARDEAHRFGERFPERSDAAELFRRVTELENAERRRQSLEQGLEVLERLIAEGRRQEAEVALGLLDQLGLDHAELDRLKRRVADL